MKSSKNVWDFFEVKYCLNQDSRPDRWIQAREEFKRVGLEVERFASLPADVPAKSFCLSQYAMLQTFCVSLSKTLLTLEDDVIFQDMGHLDAALAELPADWDIVYLGANITMGQPVRYSQHLCGVDKAWTTHCVGYSKKAALGIRHAYHPAEHGMYDDWLMRVMLPRLNAYIVNPMCAFQRTGFSDLWGQQTDYTGAFVEGNKMMSNAS